MVRVLIDITTLLELIDLYTCELVLVDNGSVINFRPDI